MQIKQKQIWIEEGRQKQKPYIFFQGYCLDLTRFYYIHPGGSTAIKNYLYKDLTIILFSIFPHNYERSIMILEKYRIGKVKEVKQTKQIKQEENQHSKIIKTILKTHKKSKKISDEDQQQRKNVQFPSQVNRLASMKQKLQQKNMAGSKRNSKNKKNQQSTNAKFNLTKSKTQQKTKQLNPSYTAALKGTKITTDNSLKMDNQKQNMFQTDQQTVQLHQNSFNESNKSLNSQSRNNLKSSTNVSIKRRIQKSYESFPQLREEQHPIIKIPILNIKVNKIW